MDNVYAISQNTNQPALVNLDQLIDTLEVRVVATFISEYERSIAQKLSLTVAAEPSLSPPVQSGANHVGSTDAIHLAVRAVDRRGRPWGNWDEALFRQTILSLLEGHFGVQVRELNLRGEQFDCLIVNGQHILVEIAPTVGPDIQKRLERKRQLYLDETGITPARFILAAGSIHSRRAEALRAAGFDVIEPEEGTEM